MRVLIVILSLAVALVVALAALAWNAGKTPEDWLDILVTGLLIVACLWTVVAILLKIPFVGLQTAIGMLAAIVLILLLLVFGLPIIRDMIYGYVYIDPLLLLAGLFFLTAVAVGSRRKKNDRSCQESKTRSFDRWRKNL